MVNRMRGLCAALALLLIASCAARGPGQEQPEASDFFFWMDSYIAAPVDSEWLVAITYYYQTNKPHLDISDISSISFSDVDDVKVASFDINDISMDKEANYEGKSITLRLAFAELGVYRTEGVVLNFADGSSAAYPIGQWVFDVDSEQSAAPVVNQEGSPGASSNSGVFPFQYAVNNAASRIVSIQLGENNVLKSFDPAPGLCEAELATGAPVVYVRPKIVIQTGENTSVEYGYGCYCGALNLDESDVQKSIDHAAQAETEPAGEAVYAHPQPEGGNAALCTSRRAASIVKATKKHPPFSAGVFRFISFPALDGMPLIRYYIYALQKQAHHILY